MRILKSLLFLIISTATANAQFTPSITKLTLVNSTTGAPIIEAVSENQTIDLKTLPSTKLNLVASTDNRSVRKVEFLTNGSSLFSDSAFPYAYKGDDGGNFNAWTPATGVYVIRITPYDKETQKSGIARTFTLTFVRGSSNPPPTQNAPETPAPTSTTTPSPTAQATPSSIPTSTPTSTPLPTQTVAPTPTPTAIPTVNPTATPTVTPTPPTATRPKAFPKAEGFGANSVGGSGRNLSVPSSTVYKVSNLNKSGAGSLSACVDAVGPRVCIFEISGKIYLDQAIQIKNPYITIAGQTAPFPGIFLVGAGFQVRTNDVLIQHLRVRVGDQLSGPTPGERDGIVVWGTQAKPAYNVVLDHLSVTWAIDENLSTYGGFVNNVTISNSIVAEALFNSIHPKGKHSMGTLVGEGSQRISILKNLYAHNQDRNPRILPENSAEFISNHVYNWGGTSGWNVANISDTNNLNKAILVNFIGNNYKMGPDSTKVASLVGSPPNSKSKVYTLDNIGPTRTSQSQSEWAITSLNEGKYRSMSPVFPLSDTLPTSSLATPGEVLKFAGARPKEINFVDQRIKSEAATGTGRIKDCLSNCKNQVGQIDTDTSNTWSLSVPKDPHGDDNSNGYTNLEEWLHAYSSSVEN